jgi:photosystem II stability/assembly factor-like uncharacterized protein
MRVDVDLPKDVATVPGHRRRRRQAAVAASLVGVVSVLAAIYLGASPRARRTTVASGAGTTTASIVTETKESQPAMQPAPEPTALTSMAPEATPLPNVPAPSVPPPTASVTRPCKRPENGQRLVSYQDLAVVDQNTFWLALPDNFPARTPTLYGTRDGGRTWIEHCLAERTYANSVVFVDRNLGWAAIGQDTKASVMRTTDGGRTWQTSPSLGSPAIARDITFIDPDHGWVVGDVTRDRTSGAVWKSSDGGRTWAMAAVPGAFSFASVHFADKLHGWAIDPDGKVASTTDGGDTWQVTALPHTTRLRDAAFADRLTGWIVGHRTGTDAGRLWSTDDGGMTWEETTPFPHEATSIQILPSGQLRVLAGSGYNDPQLFESTDQGATWAGRSIRSNITQVEFADIDHGWAVDPGLPGCALATDDGGLSWRTYPLFNTTECVTRS